MLRIRPRRRWLCLLAILLLAIHAAPRDAAGQAKPAKSAAHDLKPAFPLDTTDTTPVVFSFSGGISLGAYQAGVNWAIVEFLKYVRDSSDYRDRKRLPMIRPSVMTGASAGNINVLLGSIQYCDSTTRELPQSSLFWKMWVETGWDQLLPHDDSQRDSLSDDRGVLDRGAIRRHVIAAIDKAMNGRDSVLTATDTILRPRRFTACHIPIGVVATRVAASKISLNERISVPNQRYVGLFTLETADSGLALFAPDTGLIDDERLGAQMVLPTDEYGRVANARAFDLVEASAAYPVAFAPKVLSYMDATCVAHQSSAGCTDVHHESFLDGGVFDNYPVSLAVEMQRQLGIDSARPPRVFYVDPNLLRGALANHEESHSPPITETQVTGVNALLHFFGSFIPSARSYELQSFIRQQLDGSNTRANLMSSTRGHPLVGEHLDDFAAFLGRPFRETDFYIGVADGLRFIATDVICDPKRLDDRAGANLTKSELGRKASACIDTETIALARYGFGLDTVGQRVVDVVIGREIPGLLAKYPLVVPAESRLNADRTRVLLAVERATYEFTADNRPFKCPGGDLSEWLLCTDGFDRLLGSLSADPDVVDIVTGWNDADECQPDSYDASRCRAESDLVGFLTDPHATMQANIDRVLRQLRNAEERSGDAGDPDYKFLVKTIELLYRSGNQQGRRGPEFDPSSIEPNDGWWESMHALPYRYGGFIGRIGMELAWEPTWNFGACQLRVKTFEHCYAFLSLPIGYDRLPLHFDPRLGSGADFGTTSLLVGRNFAHVWLNQLGLGARLETKLRWPSWRTTLPLMPELSGSFMMSKLHVTMFRVPPSQWPSHRPHLLATISVSDLNGLLYWMLR